MENDFSGSGGDETLKSRRSPSCEEGAATTESISLKDAAAPSTVVSDSSKSPGKITVSFKDVTFNSDFDSGNLARVEEFKGHSDADWREFDLWVSSDCEGTEFANANRSWFYFSVAVPQNYVGRVLRFNIMNLNRQMKLYMQGLAPMIKIVPGRGTWDRLRTRLSYEYLETSGMKLSFYFNITDSRKHTLYFAFCYPYSYAECQRRLEKLDSRFKKDDKNQIYYHRELLCKSLEDHRIDLITVTSAEGISEEREEQLPHLFPDQTTERCHVFKNRKVVFISSRVHPGETPSSHVFNGVLQFLLRADDERAIVARRHFVFKLIPMLNPDGVVRGHYRTDSRGVNLNRFYLDPDRTLHPSIFAARSMMLHYHTHVNRLSTSSIHSHSSAKLSRPHSPPKLSRSHSSAKLSRSHSSAKVSRSHSSAKVSRSHSSAKLSRSYSSAKLNQSHSSTKLGSSCLTSPSLSPLYNNFNQDLSPPASDQKLSKPIVHKSDEVLSSNCMFNLIECGESEDVDEPPEDNLQITRNSGVALYVDLHAHAAKRGVFMYGNNFKDAQYQAENMLLPRLVSLNSPHLDFEHCVFSERNMYATDKKTGLSKEGSGRVGIYKATGIIPCYTLECNYNSGRQSNAISNATTDSGKASPSLPSSPMSHRFSIADFEEVGRALVVSLLDYYQLNPWSRLPTTSYGSLAGVRLSLIQRLHVSRATKIYSDDSESQGSEDKVTQQISSNSVDDDDQGELPPRLHSAIPRRSHINHTLGKSNGIIRRSKKHINFLETGNSSCVNISSKREKIHQLKPKLTNVTFPAASVVNDSASDPTLQGKINRTAAIVKCCKRTTVMLKKSSSVDGIMQSPHSQRTSDPTRMGALSHPKNSIISNRGSVVGSSRRDHLGSRGSIMVGRRRMESSMLQKGVSDSSHQVPTRTAPQTPAISRMYQ